MKTSEMNASSAQICRDLGWPVGTLLECAEQQTVIRITAIGIEEVLAVAVREGGRDLDSARSFELLWDLRVHDWQKSE
jgi:hypothetical protein